ncbi:MAG: hypothetical protein LBG99_05225 [Propionibacteriaceae bacterium]|jgi:hypothetical protein|nr:hypothetical protein [Propionibacteriaceae bacterium]
MDCKPWEWVQHPIQCGATALGEMVTGTVVDEVVNGLMAHVAEALGSTITGSLTAWFKTPSPALVGDWSSPSSTAPPSLGVQALPFFNYLLWIGNAIAIMAFLVVVALGMIRFKRGGSFTDLGRVGWVCVVIIIMGAAGDLVAVLMPLLGRGGQGLAQGVPLFVQSSTWWLMPMILVGAIIVACVKTLWTQRLDGMKDLAAKILRVIIVAGLGHVATSAGLAISDSFSSWVLRTSLSCEDLTQCFSIRITDVILGGGNISGVVTSPGLLLLLWCVGWLVSLVQWLLLLGRNAVLAVMSGLYSVAAAFDDMWRTYLGWAVALVLYKPVAALLYASVFIFTASGHGLQDLITAVALMTLSVFSLGALLKLIVPAARAMGSGGGGTMTAVAATGAMAVPMMFGGSGGSGSESSSSSSTTNTGGYSSSSTNTSGGDTSSATDASSVTQPSTAATVNQEQPLVGPGSSPTADPRSEWSPPDTSSPVPPSGSGVPNMPPPAPVPPAPGAAPSPATAADAGAGVATGGTYTAVQSTIHIAAGAIQGAQELGQEATGNS